MINLSSLLFTHIPTLVQISKYQNFNPSYIKTYIQTLPTPTFLIYYIMFRKSFRLFSENWMKFFTSEREGVFDIKRSLKDVEDKNKLLGNLQVFFI